MSPGQPFSLRAVLPSGMQPEDVYVLLAGFIAFLVVFFVGKGFVERDTLTPRLKALQERRAQMKGDLMRERRRGRKRQDGSLTLIKQVVSRLNLIRTMQANKVTGRLVAAGYRSKDAVYVYAFFKLVMPVATLFISFFMVKYDFSNPAALGWKLLVPVVAVLVGLKLPDLLLANQRGKRYAAIQKSLADTLDLMMICAEAGLSLAAALDRVSRELRLAYPEMADELSLTALEMGFLPDRKQALVNLTVRVTLPEVRGIVSVLVQTEKYGTPISQALRVLSNEFRQQRMLRAEQKAARLPAVMTVPMIIFILPTLFIVVITPAILRVIDNLAQQGG